MRADRSRLALAALAALLASTARAEPQLRPQGSERDEYAETFTFVADLDDGGYLQLQLAVTNIGPGSDNGACRALVLRPGAAAWTAHARVGRSGWRHEAQGDAETLTIGPCTATSGARTTVRVPLDGRTIELTFPEPLRARAAPTVISVGDRGYRAEVLQAFTPVEVRLTGFDAAGPLTGGGYADHSRADLSPGALARGWVRFRALRPPHRLLLLGRRLPDGRFDPAWIWREGAAPRPLGALAQARAPGGWAITVQDGGAPAALVPESPLFRHNPLKELGALGSLVGAVMDVPITATWRARLAEPTPVEGILEITTLGEDSK